MISSGDLLDVVEPELVEQRLQALGADLVRADLRVDVADRLVGLAHVGADDLEHVPVRLAGAEELQHRDLQALLVHLARLGRELAAADVGRVAGAREVGDRAPAAEDGRHDREVVDLAGRLPRVVRDQHVARLERGRRERVDEVAHARRHRVDVAGRARDRLGDHAARLVEDAAGEVLALAHDGREGRAHERGLLLVQHRADAGSRSPAA